MKLLNEKSLIIFMSEVKSLVIRQLSLPSYQNNMYILLAKKLLGLGYQYCQPQVARFVQDLFPHFRYYPASSMTKNNRASHNRDFMCALIL